MIIMNVLRASIRILPLNFLRYALGSKNIMNELLKYAQSLNSLPLASQKQDSFVKDYIQVTQKSLINKLSKGQLQIDPESLLLIIPTLNETQTIRACLIMLYDYVDVFCTKQLQMFLEYMVGYKPGLKPPMPKPKPLQQHQSILVLLSEVYEADFLGEWLKMIQVYRANNLYTLSMGYFAISQKMSKKAKQKYRFTLQKCNLRVKQIFMNQEDQAKVGVVLLALEMNHSLGEQLLIDYPLDFSMVQPQKVCLLFITLQKYLQKHFKNIKQLVYVVDQQDYTIYKQEQIKDEYSRYDQKNKVATKDKLNKVINECLEIIIQQKWQGLIKLNIFLQFYGLLRDKKMLNEQWTSFREMLFDFGQTREQQSVMESLTTTEIIQIIEIMEINRINRPLLLKGLLVLLSDRLETAEKQHLIRLAKSLVTYVRQIEDYLIAVRLVIERRKAIFSPNQLETINEAFKRVQTLFPRPIEL